MKLIKQSHEILTDFGKYDGDLKQIIFSEIEVAGRTCYKSEENMKEGSAESFTNRMIKSGHGAMLEAGSVYLKSNNSEGNKAYLLEQRYLVNRYSKVIVNEFNDDLNNRGIPFREFYITTNFRVIIENNWLDDLQYLCSPTPFHEKRISVRFICDRAVQNQLVRHRSMSFAVQSQRYCNYSKDKFGNEVSFVLPSWVDNEVCAENQNAEHECGKKKIVSKKNMAFWLLKDSLEESENYYFDLLSMGLHQEQARAVLPNATATEMVVTGFVSDWIKLFDLRTDKSAHPDIIALIEPLKNEFKERGWC